MLISGDITANVGITSQVITTWAVTKGIRNTRDTNNMWPYTDEEQAFLSGKKIN